jgi:hypothetical protein
MRPLTYSRLGVCLICHEPDAQLSGAKWCRGCTETLRRFRDLMDARNVRRPPRDTLESLLARYERRAALELPLFG